MSNIDKQAVQAVADLKAGYTLGQADVAILNELARIALASLEAEAVGEVVLGEYDDCGCHPDAKVVCIAADGQADWENFKDGTRLYTAPPAPVSVPAAMEMDDDFDSAFEHGKAVGWNAYRAAMLQSFGNSEQLNSPVIPDGWVLVPVEPTIAILDEFDSIIDYGAEDSKDAWSRLLAAAWIKSLPAAPQQEVESQIRKGKTVAREEWELGARLTKHRFKP
ncbi:MULTISPECIES: hypothetical protein [Enterobacter cloacae complex]|uniref:hypothetical protein n=1 Tax=Enterobacter cloacae complex TaxID=354276 RepID=UPI001D01696B|nr:hypothetical protein [Enterobacter hormaechei]